MRGRVPRLGGSRVIDFRTRFRPDQVTFRVQVDPNPIAGSIAKTHMGNLTRDPQRESADHLEKSVQMISFREILGKHGQDGRATPCSKLNVGSVLLRGNAAGVDFSSRCGDAILHS